MKNRKGLLLGIIIAAAIIIGGLFAIINGKDESNALQNPMEADAIYKYIGASQLPM